MSDNNIIKLAEWMGWTLQQEGGLCNHDSRLWKNPDGVGGYFTHALPNPYESDADCMALELFLGEQGWHFEECRQPTAELGDAAGVWLHIWHFESEIHHRWDGSLYLRKQGVCELALKVCDDESD